MVGNTMTTKGFTLIELLVTISIISILSVIGLTSFNIIKSKTRDTIRKSDLNRLALALDIYAQTHNGQYIPPVDASPDSCTRDTTSFYVNILPLIPYNIRPQDPKDKSDYCYISQNSGKSYVLCAKLDIPETGIPTPLACTQAGYNYGVVPK